MPFSTDSLRRSIIADYNVHGETILAIDDAESMYDAVEEREDDAQTVNEAHYLAYKDITVKFVTATGVLTFENTFDARTIVTIDEDKGDVEIDDGYFCNFKEFKQETSETEYIEPDILGNIDEIREALVPITQEQYDTLWQLKEAADEEAYDNAQGRLEAELNDFSDGEFVPITVAMERYESECDKIFEQNGIDISLNGAARSFTDNQNVNSVHDIESEKHGVMYYLASADIITKSVTPSGSTFENTVQANTLAMIDEDKGEIEFANGLFSNFRDFDEPVSDDSGVDTYEGSKIDNMDEIRKLLVPITEEQCRVLTDLSNGEVKQYNAECDKIFEQNGIVVCENSATKSIATRFDNIPNEETMVDEDIDYER